MPYYKRIRKNSNYLDLYDNVVDFGKDCLVLPPFWKRLPQPGEFFRKLIQFEVCYS